MSTTPFSRFEWMIAWRYLRARKAEGGVSTMTWISLIGVTLAVFALIATLAVRTGFRSEFVGTILGANAHVAVYEPLRRLEGGGVSRLIGDHAEKAAALHEIEGVIRAAPIIAGQALVSLDGKSAGVEAIGMAEADLRALPGLGEPGAVDGGFEGFGDGIALGSGVARNIGAEVGDRVRLVSPDGVKTAFGTSPRVVAYEVGMIFTLGRYDIDGTRVYMPFVKAQEYFNREAGADQIEVMVDDPERIDDFAAPIKGILGEEVFLWTWRDRSGGYLRALDVEDNVMFIILSILVLIAAMNIVSGLIMLVKNKGRDIGILRTMGLTEGSILRVFFICGALTGAVGTLAGSVLGCLFAIYIDPIYTFVNAVAGGGVWDPSVRNIYALPAELRLQDVLKAVSLSLGLSFFVTILPARRAARMNPVEALRYE